MKRHTIDTLSKYYGLDVKYSDGEKKGIFNAIWDGWCWIEQDDGSKIKHSARGIFPILKTVDDLTYSETESVYGYDCYDIDNYFNEIILVEQTASISTIPEIKTMDIEDGRYILSKLLKLNAGAVENKESPTGYVSMHDDLPCVRWEEG